MSKIRSLRRNVTREQAVEQFSPSGPLGLVRRAVFGPLRSVADFYIPFRVFQIEIQNRGCLESRILAVDSVTGTLTPFAFPQLPAEDELAITDTRNHPPISISEADACENAITKVQRLLFSSGFFRLRELKVSAKLALELHVPYWIGFRGDGDQARFTAMDAVRRRVEGAKVRQIVRNWLTSG